MVLQKNVTEVLSILKIFKVSLNRKWTCGRLKTVLNSIVVCTDPLCQISGSCLCGSWEKCDRNLVCIKSIPSSGKWELDMWQTWNCLTPYSSPFWCSVPNSRKLAYVVFEKNVTEIILSRQHKKIQSTTGSQGVKQEVDRRQTQNCLTPYSCPYWRSMPNIRKLPLVVSEKNVTIYFVTPTQDDDFKFRQTGSGQAVYLKLSYTVHFSILMLCAKYQEAVLYGSWEKCDRNLAYFCLYKNIKYRQTGSRCATDSKRSCTILSSILMLYTKYQEASLCSFWEKCDRIILWWRQHKTTDSDPYRSPLQNACNTINGLGFNHFPDYWRWLKR